MATRFSPGRDSRGTPSCTAGNASRSQGLVRLGYDQSKSANSAWDAAVPLTVAILRSVARLVAADLGAGGSSEAAALLTGAADTRSTPADDVLALREDFVRTNVDWVATKSGTRELAERALKESKKLAIYL